MPIQFPIQIPKVLGQPSAQKEFDELCIAIMNPATNSQTIVKLINGLTKPSCKSSFAALETVAERLRKDPKYYTTDNINAIIAAMCEKVQDCDDNKKALYVLLLYCKPLLDKILDNKTKHTLRINFLNNTIDFDLNCFNDQKYGNIYEEIFNYCVTNCKDKEVLFPVLDYVNKKAGNVFLNNNCIQTIAESGNAAAFEWALEFDNVEKFKKAVLNHQINKIYEKREKNIIDMEHLSRGLRPNDESNLEQAYALFEFVDLCGMQSMDSYELCAIIDPGKSMPVISRMNHARNIISHLDELIAGLPHRPIPERVPYGCSKKL